MREILANICNQLYELFNLELILSVSYNIFQKILPFLIIYLIIFEISYWKILIKEGKKGWYSLIPLYNVYLLFKITKIPFILFFIPVFNIITLIALPYNLARQYRCKEWARCLAVFIPFIMVPYIAFSKRTNKDLVFETRYLKYGEDVDKLDDELKIYTDDNLVVDDKNLVPIKKKKTEEIKQSKQAAFLDSLEFKNGDDEYVDESAFVEKPMLNQLEEEKPEFKDEDEFVDLEDEENPATTAAIDELDEELEETKEEEVKVETNIQDYEKFGPSVNAIAFGGKEEHENQSEAKIDELKCPRCGSSLVGANGTCPGCGAKV